MRLTPSILIASSLVAVATVGLAQAPSRPIVAAPPIERGLRIWAAGDWFPAGEGLRGIQVGEESCQRGLGLDAGSPQPPVQGMAGARQRDVRERQRHRVRSCALGPLGGRNLLVHRVYGSNIARRLTTPRRTVASRNSPRLRPPVMRPCSRWS